MILIFMEVALDLLVKVEHKIVVDHGVFECAKAFGKLLSEVRLL